MIITERLLKPDPKNKVDRTECPPPGTRGRGLELVYLELTEACNNRCSGCPNASFLANIGDRTVKSGFGSSSLTSHEWISIISRLPASVSHIVLTGGEPTLHPGFFNIVTELNRNGFAFVVFTNARWNRPLQLVSLLAQLPSFNGFLISLHGTSASTHEAFTGVKGSFDETLQNIKRATNSNLPVSISTVITKENYLELRHIVELGMALGVEEITFNRFIHEPGLDAPKSRPLDKSLFYLALDWINELKTEFSGIRIGYGPCIPECFNSSASVGCSAGEGSFVVDPWGNVKPCFHSDLLCGSILQENWNEITQSTVLVGWRNVVHNSCAQCSVFVHCGGGCRAMGLLWPTRSDPLIPEARTSPAASGPSSQFG